MAGDRQAGIFVTGRRPRRHDLRPVAARPRRRTSRAALHGCPAPFAACSRPVSAGRRDGGGAPATPMSHRCSRESPGHCRCRIRTTTWAAWRRPRTSLSIRLTSTPCTRCTFSTSRPCRNPRGSRISVWPRCSSTRTCFASCTWKTPTKRWVGKGLFHQYVLASLFEVFPDAIAVWTHRPPEE